MQVELQRFRCYDSYFATAMPAIAAVFEKGGVGGNATFCVYIAALNLDLNAVEGSRKCDYRLIRVAEKLPFRGAAILFREVDPKFADLSKKGALMDSQLPGGLQPIPSVSLKRAHDEFFFIVAH